MDLRAYYQRIREVERSLDDEYPVVKSLATEDGGKDGRLVEVSRAVAARMITDGIAKKASSKESQTLRVRVAEAREKEREAPARRVGAVYRDLGGGPASLAAAGSF